MRLTMCDNERFMVTLMTSSECIPFLICSSSAVSKVRSLPNRRRRHESRMTKQQNM